MVDNYAFTPGSGATGASDDIGGVQHPYVKIEFGPADTATPVSSATPLPVAIASASPVPVTQSGTWTAVGVSSASIVGTVTVGTHAVTQSGAWDVHITSSTAIPVTQSGTWTSVGISSASIVGAVAVTQSGTWTGVGISSATIVGSLSISSANIPALGTAVLTRGQGAGDSNTLRVTVDSSQTSGSEYEFVTSATTANILGTTGATGDFLREILVTPKTVSPGAITILDNATSSIVFQGGTNSLLTLHPFTISIGANSVSGAWKVTTGANIKCMALGDFT